MKYLIALIVGTLLCQVAGAAPLRATRVEPELGDLLGFHIFRFEAKLGDGEVLVIRERTDDQGKVTECEFAAVGNNVQAKYEIVLVDSGAFHSSLRNSYMLRYPSSNASVENKRLLRWGDDGDGVIEIAFGEIDSNEPSRKLTWSGSIEKYSEVVKRWPELPAPRANGSSGSRRLVTKTR